MPFTKLTLLFGPQRHLSFAIDDAANKAGDGVCRDVTCIRCVLDHVVTKMNIAVRRAIFYLQSKELEDTDVVLFIGVDVDEQHLT